MRIVVQDVPRRGEALTFTVEYAETPNASHGPRGDRTKDVRGGEDIEHRSGVSYGYRHVRVAWDCYLHVNQ